VSRNANAALLYGRYYNKAYLLADVDCAELVTNAIRDYIGSGKPDEKDPGRLNGWHSSKRDPNVGEIPAGDLREYY